MNWYINQVQKRMHHYPLKNQFQVFKKRNNFRSENGHTYYETKFFGVTAFSISVIYIVNSILSVDFEKFFVVFIIIFRGSEEFNCKLLTNLLVAVADFELGLESDRYEEIFSPKYCQFLNLNLEKITITDFSDRRIMR